MDAAPQIPLAVKGGERPAQEPHGTLALVTPARSQLAGAARLQPVVLAWGGGVGPDRWRLDLPGMRCVGPAQAPMAVTVEA
jgi:hypothetical protein